MSTDFRFPGATDRTTLIGATGSGKTTCAVWLWSHQSFRKPWVVVDFKRESSFDEIGMPPIQQIDLRTIPKKPGAYILTPQPGQDEALESWLWRIWEKENVGLVIDEASLMPDGNAWQAILQQGRSKRISVIACTQRPAWVKRGLFSEASFFCVYRLQDKRDYRVIEGFVPTDLSLPLPEYHWRWYDVSKNRLLAMAPVPPAESSADRIRSKLPSTVRIFHNFVRGEGRPKLTRSK